MGDLQFPPRGDIFENDIPVWMDFYANNYSTFSKNRTRSAVQHNPITYISIPYPQQHTTLNSQRYSGAGSLNVRAIETQNPLAIVGQMGMATGDKIASYFRGGNVLSFDHFESVLQPGDRRTHYFNMNLIAKTAAQATAANDIALSFQTNVFPIITDNLFTMRHPPLWAFGARLVGGGMNDYRKSQSYWDGQPLVCVLNAVDINRSVILNTPFAGTDKSPIGINIKLSFTELEPALSDGSGKNIISRSERFANADEPSRQMGTLEG